MDVLRKFYEERPLLVWFAIGMFLISIVTSVLAWRWESNVLENFQDVVAAAEKEMEENLKNLPPEITQPKTGPIFEQENCQMLKKTIDAMKLTEMGKQTKEFAKSELFQAQKSEMEGAFERLGCKEYLEKIAAGEVEAPKTPPEMRPDILPSQM